MLPITIEFQKIWRLLDESGYFRSDRRKDPFFGFDRLNGQEISAYHVSSMQQPAKLWLAE
jgi:hypothetical protein